MSINGDAVWFVTGSQHLYGEDTLRLVETQSREVVEALRSAGLPCGLEYKGVLTTPEAIHRLCLAANADDHCLGVIAWMHTFSPAKMWIAGIQELRKPLLHLHTQYHQGIPWDQIDMDFMNLNQAAHGDREFAHLLTRLGKPRKVIVGHWQASTVQHRVRDWVRTARAWAESRRIHVARFGDNMRNVAVTEGDKVAAQAVFGWSVNGYGVGDLAERVSQVSDTAVNRLVAEYRDRYEIPLHRLEDEAFWHSVREQARIELGLRAFLEEGGFTAFTTTFEDLHGLPQLPGLAVQRLMADGYGFGAEGDWKTAAWVRVVKVLAEGRGTSFMEDYTYHLADADGLILGSHMLEVCPTIAAGRPRLEVHPLSIGGKADPARLVFDGQSGSAVVSSVVDLGGRFRVIVNEVEAVSVPQPMPRLPVARVLWRPKPSFHEATEAWLWAGGAHHTCLSYHASAEQLAELAEWFGVECIVIDEHTTVRQIRDALRWNELYYKLR